MSKSKKSDEVRGTREKASYLSLIVAISNMMGRGGGVMIGFHSALHADTLTLIRQ